MLTVTVGLDLTSKVSLLPVTVRDINYIDEIFAVLVLYFAFQASLFWSAQSSPVRALPQYKLDFWASMGISCIAFIVYTFPIIRPVLTQVTEGLITYDWVVPVLTGLTSSALAALLAWMSNFARTKVRKERSRRKDIEQVVLSKLVGPEWKLIFNPNSTKGSKKITFLGDGRVGVGKNDNESEWRIRDGFLEILNSQGEVFSRFSYDNEGESFSHTNDDDTLSIRSQRIEPWKAMTAA